MKSALGPKKPSPTKIGILRAPLHTDQFLVEMFHNYAFKECIFVENLKLWLLILKTTLL